MNEKTETKLEKTIAKHLQLKKNIQEPSFNKEKEFYTIMKFKKLGFYLAMKMADYQCEHCNKKQELTFNHLVFKGTKLIIDINKYIGIRHYYENITILCRDCHEGYHILNPTKTALEKDRLKVLSDKTMQNIKKYWSD